MRSLESYLSEYAESHQNPRNVWIHNMCVPLIAWSVLGFLHSIPVTSAMSVGHIFAGLAMLYYSGFRKPALWFSMLGFMVLSFLSFELIPNLRIASLIIFVVAWVGQFYGHHVEGKKPSFLKDLLFLLIGPLWVAVKAFPQLMK